MELTGSAGRCRDGTGERASLDGADLAPWGRTVLVTWCKECQWRATNAAMENARGRAVRRSCCGCACVANAVPGASSELSQKLQLWT